MKAVELKKTIDQILGSEAIDDFGFMVEICDHKGNKAHYKISGVTQIYQLPQKRGFLLEMIIGDEVKG